VRRRNDLQQAFFTRGGQRLHVLVQDRLERLRGFPFRMLRRHRLDAVDGECDLNVDRLFAPQCAVIIEGRDALLGRDEIGPALCRDTGDKIGDGFLDRAVVPGGQRVVLGQRARASDHDKADSEQRPDK
jgi:hypothetical protein